MWRRAVRGQTRRHWSIGDRGESEQIPVHDLLPVYGQGRRAARAEIVERRPARVEDEAIGKNQRILPNRELVVAPHERGMLGTDPREVELTGHQCREFHHRLVDDDNDETIDVRRTAHIGGKVSAPREHPPPVRLVRHEPEGTVAHRMDVPRGVPQTGVRHAVEQVRGQDREIGEYVRQIVARSSDRRAGESQLDRGIIQRRHRRHRLEVREARIAGRRVACRLQRPDDVARRCCDAVVPAHIRPQPERQRASTVRPPPAAREVGPGHEQRVVSSERREQDVALHLTRERVNGEQRVDALEIGAGREQDGRAAAHGCIAARAH